MARKNAIVKCTACGAVWLSQAQRPRCAVRTCRSTAVQRLTVAEVEDLIGDLLECLNEFDADTYYAFVKIDDEQYQKLPADFDLSEILIEAIDAGDEEEEEEPEDEEVEDDEDEDVEESPKEKALAVVREERACKKVILALIPDEPENEEAREELEDEIAVLDRRYYALLRVGDDDTEEEEG